MRELKKVGILGTGSMGKGLAVAFAEAGNTVCLGSREADKGKKIAELLSHCKITGGSNQDAAEQSEYVVLAMRYQKDHPVLGELKPLLADKVIIDISNPIIDVGGDIEPLWRISASESIAGELEHSKVIGAFKNTFASTLSSPYFDQMKSHVLVVGDDQQAKNEFIQMVNFMPFEALDAGPLRMARVLEGMSAMMYSFAQQASYRNKIGIRLLN
ncbi:NAD(P)-binding domain-containing protein [Paenibacillus sp. YPG26]|uniref:NADPH-dependent F420 reductase n=1 Tax=Paenibacillus sp. YPG26 TaxID=2878915 RepID=UPI00203E0331|nr:NAD(P)-binding domain-containing protein [Paenibacillus sp. YPG26]USB32700.1 NAD(P)-binding domain-containing protein [Paenibacillus sp. YPG26]